MLVESPLEKQLTNWFVKAIYIANEQKEPCFINGSFYEKEHYKMVRSFTREMEELGKKYELYLLRFNLLMLPERISQQLGIEKGSKSASAKKNSRELMMEKPLPILLHIFPYTEKFSLDSKDYYGSLYDYLKTFDIAVSE